MTKTREDILSVILEPTTSPSFHGLGRCPTHLDDDSVKNYRKYRHLRMIVELCIRLTAEFSDFPPGISMRNQSFNFCSYFIRKLLVNSLQRFLQLWTKFPPGIVRVVSNMYHASRRLASATVQ